MLEVKESSRSASPLREERSSLSSRPSLPLRASDVAPLLAGAAASSGSSSRGNGIGNGGEASAHSLHEYYAQPSPSALSPEPSQAGSSSLGASMRSSSRYAYDSPHSSASHLVKPSSPPRARGGAQVSPASLVLPAWGVTDPLRLLSPLSKR